MTIVTAIYSNKGGVGKTATAINLDLLPSDFNLRNLDVAFYKFKRPENRLGKMIKLYSFFVADRKNGN